MNNMEASRITSFNDMELDDDSFMDYLQIDSSIDEDIIGPSTFPGNINIFNQETNNDQVDLHTIIKEKHIKQLKTNNWNNNDSHKMNHKLLSSQGEAASSSIILSFDGSSNYCYQNRGLNDHPQVANKKTRAMASLLQQSRDEHILTERRRREKLNQRFIALSTIIPGLKKMDKATVLGDAFKYVKQLEKQVKTLEEVTNKKMIKSAILVNQSTVSKDDDRHSSMENYASSRGSVDGQYPEIEARFSNKEVLIRIHCEKKNRVVEKLISEIENLHLVVINSNALVFGCESLDATFVAQMGDGFTMTAKDVVRHLHTGLKSLM